MINLSVLYKLEEKNARVPTKAYKGDTCFDLYSTEDKIIYPRSTGVVSTGLRIILPEGWGAQVRSRSGLASKGIIVANSPGTIDNNYRGIIKIIILNSGSDAFGVGIGDRIAQVYFEEIPTVEWIEDIDDIFGYLDGERKEKGFGSSGS